MTIKLIHTPEGFVTPDDLAANLLPTSQAPAPEPALSRVYDGAVRFTTVNGSTTEQSLGVTRHTVNHSGTAGGSVAATMRRDGMTCSVELEPGQPHTRTDVRTAERLGLLRMDQGRYVDVGQPEAAQARQALQEPPQVPEQVDPGAEVFDPQVDAALAQDFADVPQPAIEAALSRGTALLVNGTGSVEDIGRALARDAGMEPAQGIEWAKNLAWYFEEAATKAVMAAGVEADQLPGFWQEVRTSQRGPLQDAVQKLTLFRDPSGLKAMGQAYANRNPGQVVQALKSAGWEVARTHEGWMVRRGAGGWQPVSAIVANMKG